MMYDDWDGHGWGWGTWLGMSVMMVGLTALLVLLVVLLVRATGASAPPSGPAAPPAQHEGSPSTRPPADSAQRLLDERFARGDIDEQEYLARRGLLRS